MTTTMTRVHECYTRPEKGMKGLNWVFEQPPGCVQGDRTSVQQGQRPG